MGAEKTAAASATEGARPTIDLTANLKAAADAKAAVAAATLDYNTKAAAAATARALAVKAQADAKAAADAEVTANANVKATESLIGKADVQAVLQAKIDANNKA